MNFVGVLMHIFYLVNVWVGVVTHRWNDSTTHLWSLSVEEQFYILFPLIALVVSVRSLPAICLFIMILSVLSFIVLNEYGDPHFIYTWSPVAFGKIALGGLSVLMFASDRVQPGHRAALPAVLLALYIFLPVIGPAFHSSDVNMFLKWAPLSVLVGALLVLVQRNQSSIFVRLLEIPPLRAFGRVSYGFYVYHLPLNMYFIGRVLHLNLINHLGHIERHLLDFCLPAIAAALSWQFIEKPFMTRRSRRDARDRGVGLDSGAETVSTG